MTIFLLILFGFLGGIFGGMGMGGGTLLIPLLTIFLEVSQKNAQLFNLISFIAMAAFVIIIHFKNKLINFKAGLIITVFGVVFSVLSALLVSRTDSEVLRFLFGTFLIVLSSIEFTLIILNRKSK